MLGGDRKCLSQALFRRGSHSPCPPGGLLCLVCSRDTEKLASLTGDMRQGDITPISVFLSTAPSIPPTWAILAGTLSGHLRPGMTASVYAVVDRSLLYAAKVSPLGSPARPAWQHVGRRPDKEEKECQD